MLDRESAMNLLEIGLRYAKADQTEIVLLDSEQGLTRLANGGIHQHSTVANMEVRVRAVIGKRVGVAVSNRYAQGDLERLIDQAIAIAKVSAPDKQFSSLPTSDSTGAPGLAGPLPTPVPKAEPMTPERRVDAAAAIVTTARGNGVMAAGHVSTTRTALAVGNSLGIRAFHTWPECGVMAIMTRDGASGYADWAGTDLADAPLEAVAARASSKCLASADPMKLAPGRYTVILEPPAVAEMLSMLAMMGLGATAYQEERSFLHGRLGELLAGENISLRDDAYAPGMITVPFDYEGVPKQVVPFFERGVAAGVVYDSYTAQKVDKRSTGHALPAPNPYGPLPTNLVLNVGGVASDTLIHGVERGVLVTRFHYVNIIHPKETTITGMTRDGTFLIEDGSVTRPVSNIRFTQSILQAFQQVTGISSTQTLINQEGIYCLVPTLRIDNFSFTS